MLIGRWKKIKRIGFKKFYSRSKNVGNCRNVLVVSNQARSHHRIKQSNTNLVQSFKGSLDMFKLSPSDICHHPSWCMTSRTYDYLRLSSRISVTTQGAPTISKRLVVWFKGFHTSVFMHSFHPTNYLLPNTWRSDKRQCGLHQNTRFHHYFNEIWVPLQRGNNVLPFPPTLLATMLLSTIF